ncbi:hypothetical protein C1646_752406 [Rhizophagus diaphanus]|nr:hypothetical protein C1646_752406 [Rhizophagus diaphanus] [Rhizophagus sp. MUCL 43196]
MAYKSLPPQTAYIPLSDSIMLQKSVNCPLATVHLPAGECSCYGREAADPEEELDDDNISDEVVPESSIRLQRKKKDDVNSINDTDSTEDILEEFKLEGLEYIFNNLSEANKNLKMEDQNKLIVISKEDFITKLRSQRATVETSNPHFANDEQHLEAMGNQMTSRSQYLLKGITSNIGESMNANKKGIIMT